MARMKWTKAARAAFARRMKAARAKAAAKPIRQRVGSARRRKRRNPDLVTITNPAGVRERAEAAVRRFHGPGVKIKRRPLPPGLPDLVSLGLIEDVAYRPRRGERSGPRGWVHRFGRGAVLAAPVSGKGPLYVIPAAGRPFVVDWERGIVG